MDSGHVHGELVAAGKRGKTGSPTVDADGNGQRSHRDVVLLVAGRHVQLGDVIEVERRHPYVLDRAVEGGVGPDGDRVGEGPWPGGRQKFPVSQAVLRHEGDRAANTDELGELIPGSGEVVVNPSLLRPPSRVVREIVGPGHAYHGHVVAAPLAVDPNVGHETHVRERHLGIVVAVAGKELYIVPQAELGVVELDRLLPGHVDHAVADLDRAVDGPDRRPNEQRVLVDSRFRHRPAGLVQEHPACGQRVGKPHVQHVVASAGLHGDVCQRLSGRAHAAQAEQRRCKDHPIVAAGVVGACIEDEIGDVQKGQRLEGHAVAGAHYLADACRGIRNRDVVAVARRDQR